jgi:uncharacterized protein YkwD
MNRVLSAAAAAALVFATPAGATLGGMQNAARPGGQASVAARSTQRVEAVADLERQTLVAINDVRRENGLAPVRLNAALASAAREHSLSMAEHGFFRHESWDGTAFWKRIEPMYPQLPGRTWSTGENLVWASPELTARAAVDLWLKSAPHRKNLLAPSWRDVGLGGVRALGASGVYEGLDVTILTVDFGAR